MEHSNTSTVVGYIGLGSAGYPMAANLARSGFKLLVQDANPDASKRFAEEFPDSLIATSYKSFRDPNIDVVVTMLPDGNTVRAVLFGEQGIAKWLQKGCVVVDTSSSSPFHTRTLGKDLARLGIGLIDSPITQSRLHGIAGGEATLMVGFDVEQQLNRALPVLRGMSKHIFIMGDLGAGHIMKTLNNYCGAEALVSVCDALIVGQKFGLDPETMLNVLKVGTGQNFTSTYSLSQPDRYKTGYKLSLLIKDLKIAKEVIDSVGFETTFPAATIGYLEQAKEFCGPDACHTECLRGWEARAGNKELMTRLKPTFL